MRVAVVTVIALAFAASAAAAPPAAGLLVPGQSLGGLRLGATQADVERAWGRAYGRCTSCRHETWYFNQYAFQPRGAGVEFRRGRVAAIFTLYQPPGWATTDGVALGEPASRARAEYPLFRRHGCGRYYALVRRRGDVVTALYVLDTRLWAFAILRPGVSICR